jgi:hypothetical protein
VMFDVCVFDEPGTVSYLVSYRIVSNCIWVQDTSLKSSDRSTLSLSCEFLSLEISQEGLTVLILGLSRFRTSNKLQFHSSLGSTK